MLQSMNVLSGSKLTGLAVVAGLGTLLMPVGAEAQVLLDNGLTPPAVGAVSVSVEDGGELGSYNLTALQIDGTVATEQVIFDYFTYVQVGGGNSIRLGGSSPTLAANGSVVSTGSFTGAAGNNIDWQATSTLAAGSTVFSTIYTFDAAEGSLGDLRLIQYLDEDVFGVSDDVFFTRGSIAGGDLGLFTIDGATGLGVQQSGAFNEGQGLVNSSFVGFAADDFNEMKPRIDDGTVTFALNGIIDEDLEPFSVDFIDGTVFGPDDIVTSIAYDVVASASTSTIITSLGGVPDITVIPDSIDPVDPDPTAPNVIPTPTALFAGAPLLAGLILRRRRQTPVEA